MGIYRTLLEEEVPHLDDNNNPDEQIKELMDVVEDQDANQAEQDRAQEAEFAEPGTQADDLLAESWMAIYEFESSHVELMKAIGMHELNEAACGRDLLWEAPDIKGFFANVKKKVVEFFKKVWSVLQRWAGNLAAVFTSNKKFVEKYGDHINTGYQLISKDNSAKNMNGYSFKGLDSVNVDTKSVQVMKDLGNNISILKNASSIPEMIEKGTSFTANTAEDYDDLVGTIRALLCGGNESTVSAGDFSSKLKANLYGGDKPDKMLMKPDDIKKILSDKKDDRKKVQDFMKESKKQMKDAIDDINKMEKAASNASASNDRQTATKNAIISECTRAVSALRQVLSATQIWRSATLGAINARARQARRYGMAYVAAANRDKHKGFKESTEYGFLGKLNLV